MSEQKSLLANEPVAIEKAASAEQATSLLAVIAHAATDPNVNIEKMERLLAMQQTILEEQRKAAFAAALSRLQARLPQIDRHGRIVVKGMERSRYAKIEDIDIVIRPFMAEEGFAFSFDSHSTDGKLFTISCKLSHREGHSETKSLMLPMDASDYRSNVQSIGSTVSYGKRQLIKMHLNLVERDEDDDGNGGDQKITQEQSVKLRGLLTELHVNEEKFLTFMGVEFLQDILARDFGKAMNAIDTKRRANAGSPVPTRK